MKASIELLIADVRCHGRDQAYFDVGLLEYFVEQSTSGGLAVSAGDHDHLELALGEASQQLCRHTFDQARLKKVSNSF